MLRNSGGLSGMKSPENVAMAEIFDLLPGNQPWGMAMDGDGWRWGMVVLQSKSSLQTTRICR